MSFANTLLDLTNSHDPPISPSSVVTGDFNYVANKNEDLVYYGISQNEKSRRRKNYDNRGASIINSILDGASLCDRTAISHGKAAFTRHDKSNKMHSRIDRIYTPEDCTVDIDDESDAAESSNPDPTQPCPLQFDALMQCSLDSREDLLWPSDHRPVTLTVSTLARPQPVTPRIQRKLLFNGDLRRKINTIIEKFFPVTTTTDANGKVSHKYSTPDSDEEMIEKYELMKGTILSAVMDYQELRNKKKKADKKKDKLLAKQRTAAARSLEQILDNGLEPSPGSRDWSSVIEDLLDEDKALDSSFDTRCKAALSTSLRNSTGSADFYRPYKASRANSSINELYDIADWKKAARGKDEHIAQRAPANASTPATVLAAARAFYDHLFAPKEPLLKENSLSTFLSHLARKPIPLDSRESCEEDISEAEVKKSISKSATGKACGPDGIPVELFRIHSASLTPILTALFKAIHSQGHLTDSMEEGELTLLYKKNERADIRNYRPNPLEC